MKEVLPGDGIRTKRKIYWHYGLFAGDVDGKKMVFENTLKGVRLVTLEDFADGKELEVIPYEGATKREEIIFRASSILGKKKYNLLKNNCEHFVSWCQDGEARSLQVRTGVKISAVAIAALGLGVAGKLVYSRLRKKYRLSR